MEVAGLVVGVAGLYGTCLQGLEQIDTGIHFNSTAEPLFARWNNARYLLKEWGNNIGIQDGVIHQPHHPKLDDAEARDNVLYSLATIENIMSDRKRLSDRYGLNTPLPSTTITTTITETKTSLDARRPGWVRRARWGVWDQTKFAGLVEHLEAIVDKLDKIIPPKAKDDESLAELRSRIDERTRTALEGMETLMRQQRNFIDSQEQDKVRNWLEPVYTTGEFEEAVSERGEGTCEWIVHPDGLVNGWSREDAECLWIHAPAGFGKTFISAKVIEHLRATSSHPLAYFFCLHSDDRKRAPFSILRSWIAQIARQHKGAFEEVKRMRIEMDNEPPTHSTLWSLFKRVITKVPNCRFIVDGFDECVDPPEMSHFSGGRTRFLQDMLTSIASSTAVIVMVSRDEMDIREGLGRKAPVPTDSRVLEYAITQDDTKDDIEAFSKKVVSEKLPTKDKAEQGKVALKLSSKAQGMFLWVRLEKERLKSSYTVEKLEETISGMPTGLDRLSQTFKRSLSAISEQQEWADRERAEDILRWALFAARPLTVGELSEALVVRDDIEDLPRKDLPKLIDEQYINDMISAPCGSLITVKNLTKTEEAAHWTVHLAHFSVKEFLLKNTQSMTEGRSMLNLYKNGKLNHGLLAKTCLTYLLFRSFANGPCPSKPLLNLRKRNFAFLQYAATHWPGHAPIHWLGNGDSDGDALLDRSLIPKSLKLLDCEGNDQNFQAWMQVFYDESDLGERSDHPVYYSASLGLVEELREQIRRGVDVTAIGEKHGSAIHVAALFGQENVVKFLLEEHNKIGVNSKAGRLGQTPLSLAADGGHVAVIQLLLKNRADIDDTDICGETPLFHAAERRRKAAVELLLAKGAKVENLYKSDSAYAADINSAYFYPNEKAFLRVVGYVDNVSKSSPS